MLLTVTFFAQNQEKSILGVTDRPAQGPSTQITINTDINQGWPISPYIWGLNFEGFNKYSAPGDFYNYIKGQQPNDDLVKNLKIAIIRVPGGCPASSYYWRDGKRYWIRTPQSLINWPADQIATDTVTTDAQNNQHRVRQNITVDGFLEIAHRYKTQILWELNMDTDSAHNSCNEYPDYPSADKNLSAAQNALKDGKDFINKYKNDIRYIELTNEEWGWDRKIYAKTALDFAQMIKAIDPQIKIILTGYLTISYNHNNPVADITANSDWYKSISTNFNQQCNGVPCFDYVNDHPYIDRSASYQADKPATGFNVPGLSSYTITTNFDGPNGIFQTEKKIYAPLGNALTEWNSNYNADNITGFTNEHGMYLGEMLLNMAKNKVDIANYHDFALGRSGLFEKDGAASFRSQAFSLTADIKNGTMQPVVVNQSPTISLPGDPNPNLSNFVGGTIPLITAYSAYGSGRNNFFVYIVNRSETIQNASVSFSNDQALALNNTSVSEIIGTKFTNTEFTVNTQTIPVVNGSTLTMSLAPVSITRLTIPINVDPGVCLSSVLRVGSDPHELLIVSQSSKPQTNFNYLVYDLDKPRDATNALKQSCVAAPGNPESDTCPVNSKPLAFSNISQPRTIDITNINTASIFTPDQSWEGKTPQHLQINGFFKGPTGRSTPPAGSCVMIANIPYSHTTDQFAPSRSSSYCQSLEKLTLPDNDSNSKVFISTSKEPVNQFTLIFYNRDNLYSDGTPKPVCFASPGAPAGQGCPVNTKIFQIQAEDKQTLRTIAGQLVNPSLFTKKDQNWQGKVPRKWQVNAYFALNGKGASPDKNCVVMF